MITYFQAIVLGLLQGVSELFPVSSLGHSVILPKLFGWNIEQGDSAFLTFLVATHLATAIVLVGFFWKDWVRIVKGMGRSFATREISQNDPYSRLGWLLVVGTVPAGILGVLLQDQLRSAFASAQFAAFFLMVNGILLYGAELLRRKAVPAKKEGSDERLAKMTWGKAIGVGTSQALALIPGMSRSGSTMAGGLLIGLSNEDSARFAFLLATPIIGAAALLKLPDLFSASHAALRGPAFVGALCSGVTAYFSVRFLVKYFETNRLTPFAAYCFGAGIVFSLALLVR
jgi:undecaprenyl-diphosphatase